MDSEWEAFLAEHGDDITTTVRESFSKNAHLFDINDGTHASWYDNQLGILVVFTEDEAEHLASEEWRLKEGFASMPAFREFLGRMLEDLTARAVESRFGDPMEAEE